MRILVIAPNWIGDAVMSLSLLQALYNDLALCSVAGAPCELHVLAPSATASVYQFSPVVHAVQTESFRHGAMQWGLRRRVGLALKTVQFDLAVVLANSLKSALVPWFAGIPTRVGYSGEFRSWVLTRTLSKPSKHNKPPMLEWYGALGGYGAAQLIPPYLQIESSTQESVCRDFQVQAGFLAVAPGAEYGPAKRWPASHFAEVIAAFLELNPQQQAVLFGGPKDVSICRDVLHAVPEMLKSRVLVLAGKTALAQAIALMSAASLLLTNDSGLMHVAAALGVPLHAVFGSSSPVHTPPLSDKAKVHYLALNCSPCFQRECPLGHTDCLVRLQPKMLIESLDMQTGRV